MKKTISLLVLFGLCVNFSFSMCIYNNGLKVWPRTKEISRNSIFIIESYYSLDFIDELMKGRKIYLRSGKSRIELKVLKRCTSLYLLDQALLKPVEKLKPGLTYMLDIGDTAEANNLGIADIRWKAGNDMDTESPEWSKSPEYSSKYKISYGCGPEIYVNFCANISDQSPAVALTRIKALKTGRTTEYYLHPDSTMLKVGEGMCGGEFDFTEGEEYEISFSLMDASGNLGKAYTEPYRFASPTDKNIYKEAFEKKCSCEEEKANYIFLGLLSFAIMLTAVFSVRMALRKKKKRNQ